MPLVANNAASRLAASIGAADTTINLLAGTGSAFPLPEAGDWFPLTLIKPNGEYEIVHCTGRAGEVLTVERGQEGTAGKAFAAGDRVELRLTAETLTTMLDDTRRAAQPFTPVQQGGGAGQGTNKVYIGWGEQGLRLQVDTTDVGHFWTSQNFDPANYLARSGGTMTGGLTISSTSPTITLQDTDNVTRSLHCSSGLIGFLNSGGGWACYSQDDGSFVASGNVGAYSDRKHKKDIRTIEGGLEIVEALRGVSYTRKRDGKACVGVIAQEVQEVVPEVVGESADGLYVDYGKLVAIIIPAVQELAAKVRKLEGA